MDTISRSLIKTFTYRILGTLFIILVTYIFTDDVIISLSVGGIEFLVKLLFYFLHERVWDSISWGLKGGKIVWLTGLPSSGKTTIANKLKKKLNRVGEKVVILDGDNIRKIFPNTGFTKKDRSEHVERVGRAAILMAESGLTVICSLVSPFEEDREKVRKLSSVPFYLIYVNCDLKECIHRDVKGLYAKALNGEIKDFTGVSQPYEEPKDPDLVLNTHEEDVNESVKKLISELRYSQILKTNWT